MAEHLMETELKFLLTDSAAQRLATLEGRDDDLVSTYFDTKNFALLKRGAVLRMRQEDGGWTQTLKAEGENAARRFEDERPSADGRIDTGLFSKKAARIAKLEDADGVAPVFETRIRRRAIRTTRGGSVIELAFDRGEIESKGARAPVLELELELKTGEMDDLLDLAREHVRSGGVRLSFTSKSERGYRLARGGPVEAVKFQKPTPDFDGDASSGFQALALAALHQLCANAEILHVTASPEAVHQARVALRHLKTFVTAFEHLVRDAGFTEVKTIIARLTTVFEDARSLDVFIADTFRPLAEHEAGAAAFGEALLAAQTVAYAKVSTAVKSDAFAADVFSLADWTLRAGWARDLARPPKASDLRSFARHVLAHRHKALLRRAERLDWSDAHGRHKLRIQAKKMRYLADALSQGGAPKSFLKRLKSLQEHLGVLNDIAVAGATSWIALDRESPGAAFTAGVLLGRRRNEIPRRIKAARKALHTFAAEDAFW